MVKNTLLLTALSAILGAMGMRLVGHMTVVLNQQTNKHFYAIIIDLLPVRESKSLFFPCVKNSLRAVVSN